MAEREEYDIITLEAEEIKDMENTSKQFEKKNWTNGLKKGLMSLQNKLNFSKKTKVHTDIEEVKVQNKKEESFEVVASPKRYNTVAVTNPQIMEDQSTCFYNEIRESIMSQISPSIDENTKLEDNYFIENKLKKSKRSISTSKLVDEEEDFEQLTDYNYILTEMEWRELLAQTSKLSEDQHQRMVVSIKCGLPGRQRGTIWEYLVKVEKYKKKSVRTYEDFLAIENTDNTDNTIGKDILRTFPHMKYHKEDLTTGNNSLFNVLKAYSTYDTEVKYCQGMNFIVFLFLQNLDQSEERAFWLLVGMMNHLKWRKLYKLDTPKLLKLLKRLKNKMMRDVADVYMHLLENELPIEGIFAPYFLTLFLYSTPVPIAERIIDCFLYKGEDFLIEMTIQMLKMKQTKILSFKSEQG